MLSMHLTERPSKEDVFGSWFRDLDAPDDTIRCAGRNGSHSARGRLHDTR